MNRREFYKELMSEYTFDKEKIFNNAKKGKFAGQRSLPLYIGMTAAAAAVVVAVGTFVFTAGGGRRGAQYFESSGSALAALSYNERIRRAMDEIRMNESSDELHDVLITFTRYLSPAEAESLLLSVLDENVPVKMLYLADGTKASGAEQVRYVFESSGDAMIEGAVVNCAGYYMAKLKQCEGVFLVEIVTDADISVVAPIVTAPETGEISDTGENVWGGPTVDVPTSETSSSESSDTDEPNTSEPAGDPDNSAVGEIDNTPDNDPETSESDTSDVPAISQPTVERLPDGVTLPEGRERFSYITDDIGAQRAYFLNENTFYVKTESAVKLYKFDGVSEVLAAQQPCEDAKVCWVSENGSRLMVTGLDENGTRNKMYIVDANNCTINDMGAEDAVGAGTIAEAAYNEALDVLALNIFEDDVYYIGTAGLSGYRIGEFAPVYASPGRVSLLAAGRAIYYAEPQNDGEFTVIFKGTDMVEAARLEGKYSVFANSAFTHAVLSGDNGTFIFDPETESCISVQSKTVSFGVSAHSFSGDDGCYTISGGAVVSADNDISILSKIDFKRSFSAKYAASASNGSVKIAASSYTDRAGSENLSFEQPVENASAEIRAAVNAAVGVNNALAGEMCSECGIDSLEKLSRVISVCFTESAGAALKSRCSVAESGELVYTNGGLSAINLSDTVLTVAEDDFGAQGTLYIRAGSFDGKTAYFTRSVKLVKENGVYKPDNIFD